MLSTEKKKELVQHILNSKTFRNAPTSIALLNYLLKADIEGKTLKEGIIDIEFFGNKGLGDKGNPRVRVNMYNLRKKLDAYYENEGADDAWKVIIDKGQYGIRFEKTDQENGLFSSINVYKILPYGLFFVALLFIVFQNIPKKKPQLWNSLMNNGFETTFYFGDAFGFKGQTVTGKEGWTRDYTINSLNAYFEMLEKKPALKETTKPANYNYVTAMAVHAAKNISHLFTVHNKDLKVHAASKTSIAEIKEGNSIYVGMVRTGNYFKTLLNDANSHIRISGKRLSVLDENGKIKYSKGIWGDGIENDFAVVSKTKSPNGTEQFYFISAHDMGVLATVEYFTNTDSIKQFCKKHLHGKDQFTALFKAEGYERTNMKLELLEVIAY